MIMVKQLIVAFIKDGRLEYKLSFIWISILFVVGDNVLH